MRRSLPALHTSFILINVQANCSRNVFSHIYSLSNLTAALLSMKPKSTLCPSNSRILLILYLIIILRQAHGQQHLRPEHTRVADLDQLLQPVVVREDLHARFRVRVVSRLELEIRQAHGAEELLHESLEAAERQAVVRDHALDLVEFGQMRGVDGLVTEDTVDREVFAGSGIRGETVETVRGDCGGVGTEHKTLSLGVGVRVAVANGAKSSILVDFTDVVEVLLVVQAFGSVGTATASAAGSGPGGPAEGGSDTASKFQKPVSTKLQQQLSVLSKGSESQNVYSRIPGSRHLSEAHVEQDLSEFLSDFAKRLAVFQLPSASMSAVKSVTSTGISNAHFGPLRAEEGLVRLDVLQQLPCGILDAVHQGNKAVAVLLHPLLCKSFALPDLGALASQRWVLETQTPLLPHCIPHLVLMASFLGDLPAFIRQHNFLRCMLVVFNHLSRAQPVKGGLHIGGRDIGKGLGCLDLGLLFDSTEDLQGDVLLAAIGGDRYGHWAPLTGHCGSVVTSMQSHINRQDRDFMFIRFA
ncbi:phenylalanyl-tRNA synthetase-like protein alpha chain [Hortaea werneckii]|nr:phenylalanyl-tRNA synthetase-like protein alpha chain [Hortaea werneckii]